jgi:hypothetical protein
MVSQDAPVLEARDRMFDASSSPTMATPRAISHHAASTKGRGDELGHAAVTAIGEDASMRSTEPFDIVATVVKRIVTIAGATRRHRDDAQVLRRVSTWALHDQR